MTDRSTSLGFMRRSLNAWWLSLLCLCAASIVLCTGEVLMARNQQTEAAEAFWQYVDLMPRQTRPTPLPQRRTTTTRSAEH